MGYSKVVYDGKVLIDLTADSVVADKLLTGFTAHGADGELINGACTFDADTQDATAVASEILKGKTAYNKGVKVTGTMNNNGAVNESITTKDQVYTVPQGYHDGSGQVAIDATEQAKIIAENIREGVEILGVTGTMSGLEDVKAQTRTATPTSSTQTILPEDGYNYLTQVTVEAIPYTETENSAGGTTVTIG